MQQILGSFYIRALYQIHSTKNTTNKKNFLVVFEHKTPLEGRKLLNIGPHCEIVLNCIRQKLDSIGDK